MEARKEEQIHFDQSAVLHSGFPAELVGQLLLIAKELNVAIGVRVGQHPKLGTMPSSPKPMSIKTKTCPDNHGIELLSGLIPADPLFLREDSEPLPENCEKRNLRVELHKIFSEAEKGGYDNLRMNGNFLEFNAPLANPPQKRRIIFSIDLSTPEVTPMIPLTPETRLSFYDATGADIDKSIDMSNVIDGNKDHFQVRLNRTEEWASLWNSEHGSFWDALPKSFPVYYQESKNDPRKPLNVAYYNSRVITGDVDLLWVAPLSDNMKKVDITHKTYNCSKPDELEKLLEEYNKLLDEIYGELAENKRELLNKVDFNVQQAGIISAYELLFILLVNESVETSLKHFKNPLQHGPETNNPGKHPSSIDDTMFHIYVRSENEDDQIITLKALTPDEPTLFDFAKKLTEMGYFIPIHPRWNMRRWGPLVQRQLELGMPVRENTYAAYTIYSSELSEEQSKEIEVTRQPSKVEEQFSLYNLQYSPPLPVRRPSFPSIFAETAANLNRQVFQRLHSLRSSSDSIQTRAQPQPNLGRRNSSGN